MLTQQIAWLNRPGSQSTGFQLIIVLSELRGGNKLLHKHSTEKRDRETVVNVLEQAVKDEVQGSGRGCRLIFLGVRRSCPACKILDADILTPD